MQNNLIDGSKEIIMKLNFFTERGFVEDQKSWDEKLNPILEVTEILLQLIPSFLDEAIIKKISANDEHKVEFEYLRILFARLMLLINELTLHIIKASGDKDFNDDLDLQFEHLKGQNENQFNVLTLDKKKLENVEELIKDSRKQKEKLKTLHGEIQAKLMDFEEIRKELTTLLNENSFLHTKTVMLLNQEQVTIETPKEMINLLEDKNITK